MSDTTPANLIKLALKDAGILGVGQTALAEDTNDALDTMNEMIAQWQVKRWLVYHLVDKSIVSTGAMSYTIGTGGDINTLRPDRLEAAYFRQIILQTSPNQIDYPLKLLESREDYSRIRLKQLQTIPQWIFYDAAYPLGVLYPWPVLQPTIYELHVILKETLPDTLALTDTINLPPQYKAALRYNLGARLMVLYKVPLDQGLIALADTSLNAIRNANAQVPRLVLPNEVVRNGVYNIYSDNTV